MFLLVIICAWGFGHMVTCIVLKRVKVVVLKMHNKNYVLIVIKGY